MLPVGLGLTMRLVDDCEEVARLEVTADDTVPIGTTAKTMRKTSLSGQKTNQVSGPYNQRRNTSQMTVVISM